MPGTPGARLTPLLTRLRGRCTSCPIGLVACTAFRSCSRGVAADVGIVSQRAERAARILRFEVESRSSGAARLQPEGRAMNKNITVVLLLVLAAGCSSKPQDGAYAPSMDPTRKVSEQDCSRPIDTDGGNLMCREVTEAERRAKIAEEERQARARREAEEGECRRPAQERLDGRALLVNFVDNYGKVEENKGIAGQITAFLNKARKVKPCPPA